MVEDGTITHWLMCSFKRPEGELRAPIYMNDEIQAIDVVRRHISLFPDHGPLLRIVPVQNIPKQRMCVDDPDEHIRQTRAPDLVLLDANDPKVLAVAKELFVKEIV